MAMGKLGFRLLVLFLIFCIVAEVECRRSGRRSRRRSSSGSTGSDTGGLIAGIVIGSIIFVVVIIFIIIKCKGRICRASSGSVASLTPDKDLPPTKPVSSISYGNTYDNAYKAPTDEYPSAPSPPPAYEYIYDQKE